jgi:hypothetical protein
MSQATFKKKESVMGFFSFTTSDTQESILNIYSSGLIRNVYMILPDDSYFEEGGYEGYGEFGGKDVYEVIAELNGKSSRNEGIDLVFKNNPEGDLDICAKMGIKVPKFSFSLKKYDDISGHSKNCPYQGYFLEECEEDYGEYEEDYED